MKVLFDEDVPAKLARFLPGHEIHTVVSLQLGGIKNGELLTLIEREGFEVFLPATRTWTSSNGLKAVPLPC